MVMANGDVGPLNVELEGVDVPAGEDARVLPADEPETAASKALRASASLFLSRKKMMRSSGVFRSRLAT